MTSNTYLARHISITKTKWRLMRIDLANISEDIKQKLSQMGIKVVKNNVEDCNVSADVPITDHASAPAISSTPSTSRRPNNNSQKTAKRKAKPTSDLVAQKKPKKFA